MTATVLPLAPAVTGIAARILDLSGKCDDINTGCLDVGHIAGLLDMVCDDVPYMRLSEAERTRWWHAAYLCRQLKTLAAELATQSEEAHLQAEQIFAAQQAGDQ